MSIEIRSKRSAIRDGALDGRHRSIWLREALAHGPPPAPQLSGTDRADVAIIGGGFVGLWTAIRIKEREPNEEVVVLEQDICGGGASGRNGGMALSWWPKLSSLVKICGPEEALRLAGASEAAISEIDDFCRAHDIDCEYRADGFLWTATAPAHLEAWRAVLDHTVRLGVKPFRPLPPDEVAARTGSPTHIAGILEEHAATLQPALLVRGLRKVALELGVRVFEQTRVVSFSRNRPVRLVTDAGATLESDRAVIAMNAWAAELPEFRRSLIVVSSDIVATEPVPDDLAQSGWRDGLGITDSQMMVNYYRTTPTGRVVFGKGTAGLSYRGRVGLSFEHDAGRSAMVVAELRRTYPALSAAAIEFDWGGPIDRTPNSMPIIGHLNGRQNIVYGVGWSGNGVGPSVVGGRMLASLALGIEDEWSTSSLIDRPHMRFPPEPARYLGGQLVRRAVMRKEAAEREGRRPRSIDVRIAGLAPAGLEDKE